MHGVGEEKKNADGWSQFATWDEGIAEVTRACRRVWNDKTPFQIEQYYVLHAGLTLLMYGQQVYQDI
jgi:hypothetical protein